MDTFEYVWTGAPSPPLDNIRVMVIVCSLSLSELLCALLDCVTVSSTQQIGFVTLGPLRHA